MDTREDEDEAALARRVAAGAAAEAEQTLCRRLAPRIRMYGLRHLGSQEAAEDLVQDVLLVLLDALRGGRVEDPSRVASFVLGTCRLLAQDRSRRQRHRQALLLHWHEPRDPHAEVVATHLDQARLAGCLQALPARERDVVRRTFFEERGADEIAAALATTPGNVRVIRHRALARLQACFEAGTSR